MDDNRVADGTNMGVVVVVTTPASKVVDGIIVDVKFKSRADCPDSPNIISTVVVGYIASVVSLVGIVCILLGDLVTEIVDGLAVLAVVALGVSTVVETDTGVSPTIVLGIVMPVVDPDTAKHSQGGKTVAKTKLSIEKYSMFDFCLRHSSVIKVC